MSRTIQMTETLVDYLQTTGVRENPVLARCRAETAEMGPMSGMQISPEQGAFMALLVRLTGAERILEVGVFTGYSSLTMALAMPEQGRITALDISDEYVGKARGYWQQAGVAHMITPIIGPGAESIAALIDKGETDHYDLAFIDADKTSYDIYYEAVLKLVRIGGLILFDNMLWGGRVADDSDDSEATSAIRALNKKIHDDQRVEMCLAAIGDGVMMCMRR